MQRSGRVRASITETPIYKHKRRWYEKEASRFASEYFEEYGVDWLNDVNKGEKDPDKQLYPIY